MSEPLVTCLCLTRNRREWLPRAIECFRLQTYATRELVIVADGEAVKDLVPEDSRIRLLLCPSGTTVGAKRNLGCASARGELIAHWDDDDWSAADRLDHQVGLLLDSEKAVMGYHSILYRETRSLRIWAEGVARRPASSRWAWRSAQGRAAGTSLCYRRAWWAAHRFLDVNCGEDDAFFAEARDAGVVFTVDGGERICATNHVGNVSGRLVGGIEWEELSEVPC